MTYDLKKLIGRMLPNRPIDNHLVVRNNVAAYRLERDMTPEELAIRCCSSTLTINKIESEEFVPSVYLAICLSIALEAPVEDLFFLSSSDDMEV